MDGSDADPEALRAYRRLYDEVAEHQVVAAAEDALTDSWIRELEQMRATLKDAADRALDAGPAACDRENDAPRRGGDPDEADAACQGLAQARDLQRLELHEVGRLLRDVDAALEAACETGMDRARQSREELARLRSVRRRAYGQQAE